MLLYLFSFVCLYVALPQQWSQFLYEVAFESLGYHCSHNLFSRHDNLVDPKILQDKSCKDLRLAVTASFLGNLSKVLNGLFTTISGHFSANYINNFHKTEVQMIILRCWTGLNLNWLKSYDTKHKYFHLCFFAIL